MACRRSELLRWFAFGAFSTTTIACKGEAKPAPVAEKASEAEAQAQAQTERARNVADSLVAAPPDTGPPTAVSTPDELDPEPPRYSVEDGTLWIDPIGCPPVTVPFNAPQGFEFVASASHWRRTHGKTSWQEVQAHEAWFDFVELDVYCASAPDTAQRKAVNAKRVHVDDQPEFPFAASKDPEVQKKRQAFEMLTDAVDAEVPMLEFRNTYPDGVPRGFIYDEYEGRCWHPRPDAGVVLHVRVSTPSSRQAQGRKWLSTLCAPLATVAVKPG